MKAEHPYNQEDASRRGAGKGEHGVPLPTYGVQPQVSGTPRKLSASVGGEAITLDDASVPGKVIHANAADSGTVDVLRSMLVYNYNSATVSVYWALQGPGITPVASRDFMGRLDCRATDEGTGPAVMPVPIVMEPGYTLHISCDTPPGGIAPLLYGMVDQYVAAGVLGYGGLLQAAGTATFNITAGSWVTVPMDDVQVTNPINVVQDAANNRVQINAEGIWYATIYVAFECSKDNTDRILFARFFDETAGAPLTANPFPASVENNANNGSLWPTVLYEVPAALVGHWFRLELGGSAQAFNNVEVKKAGAAFVRISPTI